MQVLSVSLCAFAGSSYTQRSGAPGTKSCASASGCHSVPNGGTITANGIPASYQPGQTYRIVIGHTGSTKIRNYNASMRVGTTTTVAGSFTAVTNAVLYSGSTESGMHSPTNDVDSSVFNWTAPIMGTGPVYFYISGYQGTSKSNGISTVITAISSETLTAVAEDPCRVHVFSLFQNFPNPFNPTTIIRYQLPEAGFVRVRIYDMRGRQTVVLVEGKQERGDHQVQLNANGLPSGIYFCELQLENRIITNKITLLR